MSTPLPPEAIATAARAAYEAWQRARGVPEDGRTWELMGEAQERWIAAVLAAAPAIRAAERKLLYAELGNEHHVIFTEDGWTTEHSVECRLSGHMSECGWHDAVRRIADEPRPEMLGRWRIDDIDSEGLPSLVRADPPRPAPGRGAKGGQLL